MTASTVWPDPGETTPVLRVTLGTPQQMNVYSLLRQVRLLVGIERAVVTATVRGLQTTREMATQDLLASLETAAAGRDDRRVERRVRRW